MIDRNSGRIDDEPNALPFQFSLPTMFIGTD
jgi:hypothetical protein